MRSHVGFARVQDVCDADTAWRVKTVGESEETRWNGHLDSEHDGSTSFEYANRAHICDAQSVFMRFDSEF